MKEVCNYSVPLLAALVKQLTLANALIISVIMVPYGTVWRETLVARKFGKFAAKLIYWGRKFGKSSHPQTKNCTAKLYDFQV